jgi:putative transposase
MPIPSKYLAKFSENGIYHIYNRTNNREPLFLSSENYLFFLRKYDEYLHGILDTFCWCLLPNHFHLLVRIKEEQDIYKHLELKEYQLQTPSEKLYLDKKLLLTELIERTFKRFFQSYSQAFNKMYDRHGNLFYRPFKRVEVDKDSQFTQTIVYIHANPLKHQLLKNFTLYKWSSWRTILSEAPTRLLRNEIIEWFGSKDNFIQSHTGLSQYYHNNESAIED